MKNDEINFIEKLINLNQEETQRLTIKIFNGIRYLNKLSLIKIQYLTENQFEWLNDIDFENLTTKQVEELTTQQLKILSEKNKIHLLIPDWTWINLIKNSKYLKEFFSKYQSEMKKNKINPSNQFSGNFIEKISKMDISTFSYWLGKDKNNLKEIRFFYESLLPQCSDKELWYLLNNDAINYRMYLTFKTKPDKEWLKFVFDSNTIKIEEFRLFKTENLGESLLDDENKIIPIKLTDNIAKSLTEEHLLFLFNKDTNNITVEKYAWLTDEEKFCFDPKIFVDKCFKWFCNNKITKDQITELSKTSWFQTVSNGKPLKFTISKLINEMNEKKLKEWTQSQIESLETEEVELLNIQTLKILFEWKLQYFTEKQFNGLNEFLFQNLTDWQVNKLTKTQIESLTTEQKNAIGINRLFNEKVDTEQKQEFEIFNLIQEPADFAADPNSLVQPTVRTEKNSSISELELKLSVQNQSLEIEQNRLFNEKVDTEQKQEFEIFNWMQEAADFAADQNFLIQPVRTEKNSSISELNLQHQNQSLEIEQKQELEIFNLIQKVTESRENKTQNQDLNKISLLSCVEDNSKKGNRNDMIKEVNNLKVYDGKKIKKKNSRVQKAVQLTV